MNNENDFFRLIELLEKFPYPGGRMAKFIRPNFRQLIYEFENGLSVLVKHNQHSRGNEHGLLEFGVFRGAKPCMEVLQQDKNFEYGYMSAENVIMLMDLVNSLSGRGSCNLTPSKS